MARRHRRGLLAGEPLGVVGRLLVAARRLVDLGGVDEVGLQPDLGEQVAPARRGGGEDERRTSRRRAQPRPAT
jgi:hypothetical protein